MLGILLLLSLLPIAESYGQQAAINLSAAQRRATERNWIFSRTTRMDFGVSGTAAPTITSFGGQTSIGEGFATATDVDGNLVFYASATQTYNRNGVATSNGAITGNNSATQGAVIVPHLKNPDRYLVFYTSADVVTAPNGNLFYAEYDIRQNGGLGDLVLKNQLPSSIGASIKAAEALTYAPNSSGDGFWIVTYENNETCSGSSFSCSGTSTVIKAIEVTFPTASSISFSAPVVSNVSASFYNGFGSIEFNEDFSKAMALSSYFITTFMDPTLRGGRLFELDFNAQTGVFSENWVIDLPLLAASNYYYADFSPSEDYAYVSTVFTNRLYRYDISSGNAASVSASQELRTMAISGAVQKGPNDRMYAVSNGSAGILEIQDPENPSLAAATLNTLSRNGGNGGFGMAQTALNIAVDYGDAPNSYKVLSSDDGPRHIIQYNTTGTALLTLGSSVTSEPGGVASATASSDTDNGVSSFPAISPQAAPQVITSYTVNVEVVNLTGSAANLVGWIDWNLNGTFDAGEMVSTTVAANATTASLTWSNANLPATNSVTALFARFRISTDAITAPTGIASSGEVEDYQILLCSVATVQPTSNTLFNACPTAMADLTSLEPTPTAGTSFIWRTGSTLGSPVVSDPTAVTAGLYYLFVQDNSTNCYSLASNPVTVYLAPCTDTDGDGVVDTQDLDDDNDGVLDRVEWNCGPLYSVGWTMNIPRGNYTPDQYSPSAPLAYEGIAGFNTNVFQTVQSFTVGAGVVVTNIPNNDGFLMLRDMHQTTVQAAIEQSDYIEYKFKTAATLPVNSYLSKIGMGNIFNPGNYSYSAFISEGTNYTTAIQVANGVNPATVGSSYSFLENSQVQNPYLLQPGMDYVVRIYLYGGANATTSYYYDDVHMAICQLPDTDGDGTPNHLDLNSDND
ncbi:MAG: GEVED domain-containing protein, partial [Bacteroidota bacterium]